MNATLATGRRSFTGGEVNAFAPTGPRALFLDQRMRGDLADSLRYIFQQAEGRLTVSEESLNSFLGRLESAPVSPLVFSFYCDTVIAIEENDLVEASRLLNEMVLFPGHNGRATVVDLADPAQDPLAQRIVRFVDTDPLLDIKVFAPAPSASVHCRQLIQEAFELLDAGDPGQAAEIRALLREIILAAGNLDPKAITFDGASSFMLWGGIIINSNRGGSSPLAMAQMLVHESTHNLLFGLCADEALAENRDDELYSSPLRPDARPMDGIYHATFVTARMHRVVQTLLNSGVLSLAQQEEARKELAENRRLYDNGIKVVRDHGRLTSLGITIMRGAEAHMAR